MKKVTEINEEIVGDIGRAFAFYDYGGERGLIDAFPNREAVAAFICGYTRMAIKSGMLYSTVPTIFRNVLFLNASCAISAISFAQV